MLTITEDELSRPARRREDRDVLILRVKIEAQRREVARLMNALGERPQHPANENGEAKLDDDIAIDARLLFSARDLRKALGVTPSTLYRWMKEGAFPEQIHVGSLARRNHQEGTWVVRNLRSGEWGRVFDDQARQWHRRGKELLKKLRAQQRMVLADAIRAATPQTDAEWCLEALGSHASRPLAGVIATDTTAAPHVGNTTVSSVSRLANAPWWAARSSSLRLCRTLVDYEAALGVVLRHANSLIFIDPFVDPTNRYQYGDLMRILASLQSRSTKPLVEIHRAAWYGGGNDRRPQIANVVGALEPSIQAAAKTAGLSVDVFLRDEIHDRYLITDLIGISVPYGFGTTTAPNAQTTWTRLGRDDRTR